MYPDYEINKDGSIYSLKHGKRKLLKARKSSSNYLCVMLYESGKSKQFTVHSLVAGEFIGIRPAGKVVDHIDGDVSNNDISNLRYVSPSANVKKSKPYGSVPRRDALRIKRMMPNIRNRRRIAKIYDVSLQAISNIVNGKRKL